MKINKIFCWRKGKEAKNPWRQGTKKILGDKFYCSYRGIKYNINDNNKLLHKTTN